MFGEAASAPTQPVVQAAPEEKKEVPTAGAPAKAVAKPAPKKKEPSSMKKGMIWEFADYNKATIKLEEEQVDPKMTYNFFNCERCVIIIPGKIKGVMLSRCKGSKLQCDTVISTVEIIKSNDVKIYPKISMPYISIEGCNGAQVVATLESKASLNIQVTASQSVSFEYPKDPGTFDPNDENEQDFHLYVMAETYKTKLVNGVPTTVAVDLSD